MSGIVIGLSLIIIAYAYNTVIINLKIKKSLLQFTILYCVSIVFIGGILSYFNYNHLSRVKF